MLCLAMDAQRDLVWDVLVPVAEWGAAVLICMILGMWLSGMLRRIDEESEPGRRACPKCGYDVRATPEVCPECGHALPPVEPEGEPASAGIDTSEAADAPLAIEAEPVSLAHQQGWPAPAETVSGAFAGGDAFDAINGSDMPIYIIPPGAGPFIVVEAPDGGFAVAEESAVGDPATAAKLGFVFIPCRDEQQAAALAEKLNRGEHDGTVQVDLLEPPQEGQ